MERLTNKREADAQRQEYEKRLENGYPRNIPEERFLKLAAYEDTGLEPEEAQRMKEYMKPFTIQDMDRFNEIMQAEKDGRLVVLPCKVGDIAYELIRYCDDQICDKAYVGCKDCCGYNKEEVRECRMNSLTQIVASIPYIGKIVFPTREEAEAALKKGEEADNEAD